MYDLHIYLKENNILLSSFTVPGIGQMQAINPNVAFILVHSGTRCLKQEANGNVVVELQQQAPDNFKAIREAVEEADID